MCSDVEVVFGDKKVGGEEVWSIGVIDTGECRVLEGTS